MKPAPLSWNEPGDGVERCESESRFSFPGSVPVERGGKRIKRRWDEGKGNKKGVKKEDASATQASNQTQSIDQIKINLEERLNG